MPADKEASVELDSENRNTLRARIDSYLRGNPLDTGPYGSGHDVVGIVEDLLSRAERDMRLAQRRVDRIKWELAKAGYTRV
jgi:hypothetical protein